MSPGHIGALKAIKVAAEESLFQWDRFPIVLPPSEFDPSDHQEALPLPLSGHHLAYGTRPRLQLNLFQPPPNLDELDELGRLHLPCVRNLNIEIYV